MKEEMKIPIVKSKDMVHINRPMHGLTKKTIL